MEAVDSTIWKIFEKFPEIVTQLSQLGPWGWVIAGILLALMAGGTIFLKVWLKNQAIKASNEKNDGNTSKAETKLPGEQGKLEPEILKGREALIKKAEERIQSAFKQMVRFVDVDAPLQGQYMTPSGFPKGAVVHYTAGRYVKTEAEAKATLADMASRGLGSLLIASDGLIYAARNVRAKEAMAHAGAGTWKGQDGLNRLLVGIEVACPGALDADGKAWFGDKIENPRDITVERDNHKVGKFARFTDDQEIALLALVLWHARNCPGFDPEWVVGHDEIAPNRKQDPGGSFSKTMPEFREILRLALQ